MQRNRRQIWLPAALVALAVSGLALAAKPPKPGGGGGGDPGPVPPGTIHFELWEQNTGSNFGSMQADGSGKTASIQGIPSYQLHDGVRWFLTLLPTDIVDAAGNLHEELFAITEAGVVVQLTDDLSVFHLQWNINAWGKDDSFLSFMASNAAPAPEYQEALFVAEVDWSSGIPVINAPQRVLNSGYGAGLSLIGANDWSPAGDEIIYNDEQNFDEISMKVTRFFADGTTETRQLGLHAYLPAWSAVGSRIAYTNLLDGAVWTIRPDGTGAVMLSNPSSNQRHTDPVWSPDGQHLIFTQNTRNQSKGNKPATSTVDILRISASGGATTNLTGDTNAECYPIGWR